MTETSHPDLVVDPNWELDVTTFRGTSIGAIHFYGILKREIFLPRFEDDGTTQRGWYVARERVELHRELTNAQEVELNEKDGAAHRAYRMQYTTRFDAREDVIRAAISAFESIRVDGEWLTTGYDDDLLAGVIGEELITTGGTSMGFGSPIKDINRDLVLTLDGVTLSLDDFMDLRGDHWGEALDAPTDAELDEG